MKAEVIYVHLMKNSDEEIKINIRRNNDKEHWYHIKRHSLIEKVQHILHDLTFNEHWAVVPTFCIDGFSSIGLFRMEKCV